MHGMMLGSKSGRPCEEEENIEALTLLCSALNECF